MTKTEWAKWRNSMRKLLKELPTSFELEKEEKGDVIIQNVRRYDGVDMLNLSPKSNTPIWRNFNRIQIDDELARLRTDDQPIWIVWRLLNEDSKIDHIGGLLAVTGLCVTTEWGVAENIIRYVVYGKGGIMVLNHTDMAAVPYLANIDDLRKHGIE